MAEQRAISTEWEERQDSSGLHPAFPVQSTVKPKLDFFNRDSDVPLPLDYKLTKYDVVNGRGKRSVNHVGTRRFRLMVALNLKRYYEGPTKVNKSAIVVDFFNAMRESCPRSGGFLKADPARESAWLAVGSTETKTKIGHCMRDMLALMRESDDENKRVQFEVVAAEKACGRPLPKPEAPENCMTSEQRMVLRQLESGYDGPVDRLLRKNAAGSLN